MNKLRRLGWELVITSADGESAGWYSGRRWRLGGTIMLAAGTRVEVRRRPDRRWKLVTVESEEFVEICGRRLGQDPTMQLTIVSVPPNVSNLPVVVLTACAVVVLERTIPGVPVAGA